VVLSETDNEMLTNASRGTPLGALMRRFWTPFLLSSEVAEPDCPPVRTTLLGEELLAFRDTAGRVGLVDAYCAHRRAPLFFGRNEDCGIRCVYHGWKYNTDGAVVDMPNEPPTSTFRDRIKLKAYPTREAGGVVWAYLGEPGAEPPFPVLDWADVPPENRYVRKYLFNANYLQALEGEHDSSHIGFLHSTVDGRNTDALKGTEPLDAAMFSQRIPSLHLVDTDFGLLSGACRHMPDEQEQWRVTAWLMPFISVIPTPIGTPITWIMRVPVSQEQSWMFRLSYHPHRALTAFERAHYEKGTFYPADPAPGSFQPPTDLANDYLIDRHQQRYHSFTGIRAVPDQDRAVVEGMGPVVDRSEEHLGTSDVGIIQLRRKLTRAVRAVAAGEDLAAPDALARHRIRPASVMAKTGADFIEATSPYVYSQVSWEASDDRA
jgi:phthalate 4,5-dioxygenase oxygenase subunit